MLKKVTGVRLADRSALRRAPVLELGPSSKVMPTYPLHVCASAVAGSAPRERVRVRRRTQRL
jgi:hypothetical protein